MRWINIKNGIKQRLNEILGVGDGSTAVDNTPTYWSIQSAMLENLRRVVKSIIGDSSTGRPMKGCWIESGSPAGTVNISSGYAFTKDGNIVVFKGVEEYDLSSHTNNNVYVYLKYENAEVPQVDFPTIGKSTGLIGQSGSPEIVNDDSGVIDDTSILNSSSVIVLNDDGALTNTNYVFLGTVQMTAGLISAETDIVNSKNRGLAPNSVSSEFLVPNLRVGDTISGTATFYNIVVNGTSSFTGAAAFNGNVTINDSKIIILPADAGMVKVGAAKIGYSGTVDTSALTSVEIKNGIIVGTPS